MMMLETKKINLIATAVLIFLLVCMIALFNRVAAQAPVPWQTIRGIVVDKISLAPLQGAVVQLVGSNPLKGSGTDAAGKFVLDKVAVGKVTLKITYIGYKELVMADLSLNSGKELFLQIGLEEDIKSMKELVVKGKDEKNRPLNSMSVMSTRTFSVEETQKFAAAVNDPARMAMSFAGVVGGNDGGNQVSIRGNSPYGLVWRMEGVDIPNPNHFSNVGASGGGISILSAQLLGNSDFSTGAFAAEYGNALSGIFDLKLRKGNNQKREYTFQAGVLGIDFAAEGPFKKGYEGSYLVNYRYSTLNLLGKLGVPLGDAITNFQDLSWNINLPAGKFGTFGFFGFAGNSYQIRNATKDSLKWREDPFTQYKGYFYSNTGAAGLTHQYRFGTKGYLKTVVSVSGTQNGNNLDKLYSSYTGFQRTNDEVFTQSKSTLTSTYNLKVSSGTFLRTGFVLDHYGFGLKQGYFSDSTAIWVNEINRNGKTQSGQLYAQLNHKFSTNLTANFGIHYLHLFLNGSNAVEPRLSVKYDASARHHFSAGYGLHSQIQPIGIYFIKDNAGNLVNRNLGFNKAHHFVVGYDNTVNAYTHIKTEVYYQHLFNIPVGTNPDYTYSALNMIDGFGGVAMVNKGLGRNYGLELTVEQFMHRNMYYLVSASLYNSEFRAVDKNWYNTRFNTGRALSVTFGKEWVLKGNRKNRILGFNLKSMYTGGLRYTPIDLEESIKQKGTVYKEKEAFTKQNPDYWRLDIRISLKRNYSRVTGTLSLDLQNATNRKNVGGQYFDSNTGQIRYFYQTPIIPVLSYRLEF